MSEHTMKIRLYQVDAFTDAVFHGNPAAVCILDDWLDDRLMQQIAMENNLSETAFAVQKNKQFHIRWFTPDNRSHPLRTCDTRHSPRPLHPLSLPWQ